MLVLSAVGISGLTLLCPLLAWIGYGLQNSKFRAKNVAISTDEPLSRMEVLIPAHNEARLIGVTLSSIQQAIQRLQGTSQAASAPVIRIHIGADSCSDDTADIARRFPSVTVTEFPTHRSKWLTIKALCLSSDADWVVLVDAGTLWPETLLVDMVRQMRAHAQAVALSPAYTPLKAGYLARAAWRIEKILKTIESHAGGPVSVHGATVCYRTSALKKAFAALGETLWLNDDVVLPLMLRTLNPQGVILYPVGEVKDAGIERPHLDFKRRQRLLFGNLQWVKTLWPACMQRNPVVGLIAMRRIFRIFWAYWIALLALSVALVLQNVVSAFLIIGISILGLGVAREMLNAALVSFLAPFSIWRPHWRLQGVWK